jgi:YHS domain-containing protein
MSKTLILVAVLMLAGCGKKNACCSKPTSSAVERSKDLVCNMWVDKTPTAIKAEFDNADYFFCAEECKQQFLKDPKKFATVCDCNKTKRDCKCEHCSGKRVPCDCK